MPDVYVCYDPIENCQIRGTDKASCISYSGQDTGSVAM